MTVTETDLKASTTAAPKRSTSTPKTRPTPSSKPETKSEVEAGPTLVSLTDTITALTETVARLSGEPRPARPSDEPVAVEVPAPAKESESPTSTANAISSVEESPLSHVVGRYGVYLAMFVGSGLISGSVVHFPLAPVRYLIIGVIGAALFAAASLFSDLKKHNQNGRSVVRLVLASLTLALGIGMVSGGIQHFGDFPPRAAKLIPLGIALSLASFIVRDRYRLASQHKLWLAAGCLWGLGILAIGLHVYAGSLSVPEGGHAHGAETAKVQNSADPASGESVATAPATEDHGH